MVKNRLGVSTRTTWLGLGKDDGLGYDKYLVMVNGPLSSQI